MALTNGNGKLTVNGKWTISNITYTALLLIVTGIYGWQFKTLMELKAFADRGDRWTATQGMQQNVDIERMKQFDNALSNHLRDIDSEQKDILKRLIDIDSRLIRLEERMKIVK